MLEWLVLKTTQPYILGRNLHWKQQKKDFVVLSELSASHKHDQITASTISTYSIKVLQLSIQFWSSSRQSSRSSSSLFQKLIAYMGWCLDQLTTKYTMWLSTFSFTMKEVAHKLQEWNLYHFEWQELSAMTLIASNRGFGLRSSLRGL